MLRRPPGLTRTATLFPYPPLFLSRVASKKTFQPVGVGVLHRQREPSVEQPVGHGHAHHAQAYESDLSHAAGLRAVIIARFSSDRSRRFSSGRFHTEIGRAHV